MVLVCDQETQRAATIKGVAFNPINTIEVAYTMYSYSKKALHYYVCTMIYNLCTCMPGINNKFMYWFIVESLLQTLRCQLYCNRTVNITRTDMLAHTETVKLYTYTCTCIAGFVNLMS